MAHPTLSDVIEEVVDIIDDSSYTSKTGYLTKIINKNLKMIAGSQYPLILLPTLETEADISATSGVNNKALPADFQKNLYHCYSSTRNSPVTVYPSVGQLFAQVSKIDSTGRIYGVARRGSTLVYQRLATETLTIYYHKMPTELSALSDQPDCLPEHLALDLLSTFTARDIFARIEDGIDGQKINTAYFEAQGQRRLGELAMFLGPEARETPEIIDNLHLGAAIGEGDAWLSKH